VLASGLSDNTIWLWDDAIFISIALFEKYDPHQVSRALQFLWGMGLDEDELKFTHKVRKPVLYPKKGYYYSDDDL